jgi:hypothetical protein
MLFQIYSLLIKVLRQSISLLSKMIYQNVFPIK